MRLELKDLRLQEETTLLGLTHFFLFSFSVIPVPDQVEASYGGDPVFGRFLTPWIPVPRLREDKLHGNDTDCVSPNPVSYSYIYHLRHLLAEHIYDFDGDGCSAFWNIQLVMSGNIVGFFLRHIGECNTNGCAVVVGVYKHGVNHRAKVRNFQFEDAAIV